MDIGKLDTGLTLFAVELCEDDHVPDLDWVTSTDGNDLLELVADPILWFRNNVNTPAQRRGKSNLVPTLPPDALVTTAFRFAPGDGPSLTVRGESNNPFFLAKMIGASPQIIFDKERFDATLKVSVIKSLSSVDVHIEFTPDTEQDQAPKKDHPLLARLLIGLAVLDPKGFMTYLENGGSFKRKKPIKFREWMDPADHDNDPGRKFGPAPVLKFVVPDDVKDLTAYVAITNCAQVDDELGQKRGTCPSGCCKASGTIVEYEGDGDRIIIEIDLMKAAAWPPNPLPQTTLTPEE